MTNKCECPAGSYLNINLNKCFRCPDGYNYDAASHKCVSKQTCPSGQLYDANTQRCVCPANSFWNVFTQNCVTCQSNQHWDSSQNSCVSCPINYYYDSVSKKCVSNGGYQQTCTGGQQYDQNIRQCVCPTTSPYWTGSACVNCNTGSYWDVNSRSCLQCPANTYYNGITKQCLTCPAGYSFDSSSQKCV